MNTRLTRRQTSLSDRATLVLPRYPEVNALMRTDAKAQKTFVNVIYGKQSLIDAGAGPGAATMPIAEGLRAAHRSVEQSIAGGGLSARR
jgi:hypothetical protein